MGQVRWKIFIQHTISVTLPSVYQNLLKWVEIWLSSDSNKNAQFLLRHSVDYGWLKVIRTGTIRKLRCGFVAVSLAVCEISSVEKWRGLENWVRGRWIKVIENGAVRYDFLLVLVGHCTIALSCASYLASNNIVTLRSGSEVLQDHSNRYHSKAWVRFTICLPW